MGVGSETGRRTAAALGDAFDSECPGRAVLNHVCSRWGTLILLSLRERPARFYELRDTIGGISEKMLSQNLRTLTRDGLIRREVEPDTPPKVTYSLTELGRELATPLQGLLDWVGARTVDVVRAQRRHDRLHKPES
ncbi:winged helix-turn-helix transcriptional regulator [Amycolatopsis sp. WGS_07]|uniref:winged helix-turn-helix transcriptional regulator n=1 Tax=Amycolatopsis sp. WGS_07 TaxID=3076764 RepID=UPI0038734596